jgi:uncharacterized metal-binding protein YceD (DUF177 family)
MKNSRAFDILHVGLAIGVHDFEYHLTDSFFEQFAPPPFSAPNVVVNLALDKKKSLFILNFSINGIVQSVCDRCGDEFELKILDEFELIAKLTATEKVAEMNDIDEDVVYFDRTENSINISTLLYEQVILSLPMQIQHATNKDGSSSCNPEALRLLEQMQQQANEQQQQTTQANTNRSLQEQLNKIKIK